MGEPVAPGPRVYLDQASGGRLHPAAREAWLAAVDAGWADPRRRYTEARASARLLDDALESLAADLGVRVPEISVTGSGASATHLAILGGLAGRRRWGDRLVTSAVEHSSVLAAAAYHERGGGTAVRVGVGQTARVDAERFAREVALPGCALASLQLANHEVGTRQPVATLARACAAAAVPLHADLSTLAGHEPVDLAALGVQLASVSAACWGGPPGVGLLIVTGGARWRPVGPADPRGDRRGLAVVDLPGLVAAAAALRAVRPQMAATRSHHAELSGQLRAAVRATCPDVLELGDPEPAGRVAHLVAFSALEVSGEELLDALDASGFAVSSGSSCGAGEVEPSHVLQAMGVPTSGHLRVSFGPETTGEEVERFAGELAKTLARLRASPAQLGPSPAQLGPSPAAPGSPTPGLVDARGLRCPAPVLALARALPGVDVGAEVTLLADDPAARADVPAWCGLRGQELVSQELVSHEVVSRDTNGPEGPGRAPGPVLMFRIRRRR